MQSINKLLARLFDWHSTATRKEFACVFLSCIAANLLIAVPYVFVVIEYASLVIDYGVSSAEMFLADALLEWKIVLLLYLWCFVTWCLSVFEMFLAAFTTIRRLNDIGISKWYVTLHFFPVINFLFLIFLLFMPSKKGV